MANDVIFKREREKRKKEVEVARGLHQSKHTFIFIAITMLNKLMCKVSFAVGVGPASLMKVAERRLLSELQIVLQDGSETCFDVWFRDSSTEKRQETELKIIRFLLGLTRMDKFRNERMGGTAKDIKL